tara:strand:+ start:325 stop:942 length:618 start_codon:yes stop_codon:yes gene_type:complete
MSKVIVIAAPSGAGKTSLIESLLKEDEDHKIKLGVSFTTRKKRENEINGLSYFFISKDEFIGMHERNEFLESAEVFGNLYGTNKSWVEKQIKADSKVLLELDWQGAKQVKSSFPDCLTLFILPPSLQELKERLMKRGLDDLDIVERRLSLAKKDISEGKSFDFLIINDVFENSLNDLKKIILEGKGLSKERANKANNLLEELLKN